MVQRESVRVHGVLKYSTQRMLNPQLSVYVDAGSVSSACILVAVALYLQYGQLLYGLQNKIEMRKKEAPCSYIDDTDIQVHLKVLISKNSGFRKHILVIIQNPLDRRPIIFSMHKIVIVVARSLVHNAVIAFARCTVILAESGPEATASMSGFPDHNAVVIANNGSWGGVPVPTPGAKWVWYTDAARPLEVVTIKHNFTIKCPNQPLTLTINVDNFFTFELNGVIGKGDSWPTTYTFPIDTTGVQCGDTLTLTIRAENEYGPAGVLYAVTSDDCKSKGCQCPACSKTVPGCVTCVCDTFCSSCDTKNFWKYDPVNGECVCIDGYYKNPNNRCVPCPDPMHCKTCGYNSKLSRVQCLSCSCEQKRVLYARNRYCGCANGTECQSFKDPWVPIDIGLGGDLRPDFPVQGELVKPDASVLVDSVQDCCM